MNYPKKSFHKIVKITIVAALVLCSAIYTCPANAESKKGDTKHNCIGDSTPLQFIPKTSPDDHPLINELGKYSKCPQCGMDRAMWNHSRHLVQYADNLVVGTCSIRCLAVNLSLNLDRGIKAIYAADFEADKKIKPLINADKAVYLIGSGLKATMSHRSKMAFSSADKAKDVMAVQGGTLGSFDEALKAAYLDMAKDTIMIRKHRAEKHKRMMKKNKQE